MDKKMAFNSEVATFGVAGNFTGHLEQANEASDFANVKTAETNAPKAIFPESAGFWATFADTSFMTCRADSI